MLALAEASLLRPQPLMIDELSLGLAPAIVETLLDTLRQLKREGTTILLVEQSLNVAVTVADRAVFLDRGEVRFDGTATELLSRPDLVRAVFMGAATTGGSRRRRPHGTDVETALDVSGVGVHYGGIAALTDVSLSVAAREVVGLIGPNGAGKTTLFAVVRTGPGRDRSAGPGDPATGPRDRMCCPGHRARPAARHQHLRQVGGDGAGAGPHNGRSR